MSIFIIIKIFAVRNVFLVSTSRHTYSATIIDLSKVNASTRPRDGGGVPETIVGHQGH